MAFIRPWWESQAGTANRLFGDVPGVARPVLGVEWSGRNAVAQRLAAYTPPPGVPMRGRYMYEAYNGLLPQIDNLQTVDRPFLISDPAMPAQAVGARRGAAPVQRRARGPDRGVVPPAEVPLDVKVKAIWGRYGPSLGPRQYIGNPVGAAMGTSLLTRDQLIGRRMEADSRQIRDQINLANQQLIRTVQDWYSRRGVNVTPDEALVIARGMLNLKPVEFQPGPFPVPRFYKQAVQARGGLQQAKAQRKAEAEQPENAALASEARPGEVRRDVPAPRSTLGAQVREISAAQYNQYQEMAYDSLRKDARFSGVPDWILRSLAREWMKRRYRIGGS